MKLHEVQEVLTIFNREIQNLVSSFDLENVEYDHQNPDEKLLKDELINNALDNILYGGGIISYMNKPIAFTGILNVQNGYFCIDNYKLTDLSVIEVFVDGEWMKVEINKIKNEYYIGLCSVSNFKEKQLQARIRLSEAERLAI